MDFIKLHFCIAILIAECCKGPTSSAVVKRDAPCQTKLFKGSPSNTMHPTKGKEKINNGGTLKQEAGQQSKLAEAIRRAESNPYLKTAISNGKNNDLDYNESLAIFVYTLDTLNFYSDFNTALRDGDDTKYPIYHYFLDRGVKKLAKKQGNKKRTVYRGNKLFFTFNMNTTTFPGFTSSSLDLEVAKRPFFFGDGCTMFKITTRQGAYLEDMTSMPGEKEVLIPPYEVFRVGAYEKKGGIQFMTMSGSSNFMTMTSGYSNFNSGPIIISYVILGCILFM